MVVLDTHIWLWWMNNDVQLKPLWAEMIDRADLVSVSAISLFEVAWLQKHGRIILPENPVAWFEKALTGSNINLIPITPDIATIAVGLTEYHSDPQDRIIIATSIANDAQLLSADTKFKLYPELDGLLIQ
jgi:PIN domain nuclease of toxin-antitoxin system